MALRYFPIRYGIFEELETLIDPETRDIWITQKTLRVLLGWDDNNDPKKLKSKSLKVFTGERFTTLKSHKGKDIAGKDNNFKSLRDVFFDGLQSKKTYILQGFGVD